MRKWRRIRLLGFDIALAAVGALALGACNSGSVSGNAQGVAGSKQAETRSPSAPAQAPAKGTIAEALANQLKGTK